MQEPVEIRLDAVLVLAQRGEYVLGLDFLVGRLGAVRWDALRQ